MQNTINKINEFIENKYFAGSTIIIHKDKKEVFNKYFGFNSIKNNTKMNGDEIFKIYSMSKPITVCAALILVERNLLNLDDYVYKYIPEYKNMNVLIDRYSTEVELIKNHIKIRHLLTMTSGITYHGNKFETQKEITNILKQISDPDFSLLTFAKKIAKVPLLFQPGTSWYYGMNLDILGAIIEIITGQSFDSFVQENIFDKLDMSNSGYYLKDTSKDTSVYEYRIIDDLNTLTEVDNFNRLFKNYKEKTNLPLGGSGVLCTADDYIKFLDMLLDGKDLSGTSILSQKLIKEMSQDQLKELRKDFVWDLNKDYSYGYGVRVRMENTLSPPTEIGEFGWDGLLGSASIIDPLNRITVCIMFSSHPGHNKMVQTELFEALYKDFEIKKLLAK